MSLETPEKAAMAPLSGKKRDQLSDNTDQPDASPNPKDLKFLGTGDKGKQIGSNSKDPIEIEDSPCKPEEALAVLHKERAEDDDPASVVKIIAYGGLDEEVNSDKEDKEDSPPVSLVKMFDLAQDDSNAKANPNNLDNNNSKHNDNKMEVEDADNQDNDTKMDYDSKEEEGLDTDEHSNTTNEEKKNNKNKNKNNKDHHLHDNLDDETPVLSLLTLDAHTVKWTSLSQNAKNVMPYISSDRDKAISDLDKCLKKWDGIDKNTATKDQWASAFDKSYKARKTHKGGPIKSFGMKLANTKPSELFLDSEYDGTYLFGSPLLMHGPAPINFTAPSGIPN
jgi:hypothetical protein